MSANSAEAYNAGDNREGKISAGKITAVGNLKCATQKHPEARRKGDYLNEATHG